ncbi:hypothetical protein DPMN_053306 [Dreissena polymorpha]|uniref:Secreted protein n=1 Tax=Dreissena polymorpha TaxID=45954 RepID=A0A9D4CNH6_DREPO|nr:hypothetical protein DPMN_053305 [Dreissena polymorpha]KAH3727372.1 hypothetical protein DPMN_053306 [Dreissena polymorpha]
MTASLIVLHAVRILSASALECSLERSFSDAYCACGYADADEWNKRSAFQLVLFFCGCGFADADADTDRWNSSLKGQILDSTPVNIRSVTGSTGI